jgi:hypothetical protein
MSTFKPTNYVEQVFKGMLWNYARLAGEIPSEMLLTSDEKGFSIARVDYYFTVSFFRRERKSKKKHCFTLCIFLRRDFIKEESTIHVFEPTDVESFSQINNHLISDGKTVLLTGNDEAFYLGGLLDICNPLLLIFRERLPQLPTNRKKVNLMIKVLSKPESLEELCKLYLHWFDEERLRIEMEDFTPVARPSYSVT